MLPLLYCLETGLLLSSYLPEVDRRKMMEVSQIVRTCWDNGRGGYRDPKRWPVACHTPVGRPITYRLLPQNVQFVLRQILVFPVSTSFEKDLKD